MTMRHLLVRQHFGDFFAEWLVQRPSTLLGPSHLAALLLHCFNNAVLTGLYSLFSMLLLRLVFRRSIPRHGQPFSVG